MVIGCVCPQVKAGAVFSWNIASGKNHLEKYNLYNGTSLQYSCLENPMDGGAWWAAVHGITKSDKTEQLHFHFSLSCIGEGNGNPLHYSYQKNLRDKGAWWAAVYGVAQSQT